ncbi:PQQ-binding-like beta-propeller repeat protein [Flavobacterium nitrogenifigens]|uniref:Calcineurin-like phosphoesterase n=1 Tax=Flavobacterium nitrogenifigens TaxID=1617283 RepID=A0A521DPX5_9FLAO|nr:PQQ-binding-like beta-propeller repeat protein [Flavobacterium nitrogenifigens]KAF2327413.1 PQQ-binding-like beta-propeller repeat protein [Flavobacterium nitrogenifigens]SMO73743.1 Calcineurin-like phosphoesterase [Flavobacterium nitrogenifigens]
MKQLFFRILLLFVITSGFSQNAEEKGIIKFVQLTDLHVSVGNDNDFLLQNIVKEINNSDFEFAIVTGDLTNRGADDELKQVHSILSQLKIPYYVISGNHETNWSESAGLTYKKIFGEDRFVFSKGDYVFIGFPCGPYMKMGDGFVKHEDVLWLDKTLKENLKNNNKKVLNFAHYPLDNSVSNYKELLSVLEKYSTVATFCGHGHTLRKYNFSGLSGIMGTSITSLDGKTKSYNQVIISKDSISIYQKEIDKPGVFKFSVPSKPSKIEIPKDTVAFQSPFLKDIASIYSLPAFDKKNLYFTNSIGEIKSVNLKNKNVNWKTKTGNSIYFSPIIVKNNLVIGTIEGNLLGFDTQSGKQKWTIPVGGVLVGSPIVENNRVYTASSTAFICADAVTGKVIWQSNLPASYSQGTPLIQGDKIIFGVWDSYVYCLDKNTGKLIWKWNNGNDKQILYSAGNVNMVASKNRLYFVTPQRFLTILDIETGKTLLRTQKWKIRESMGKSQDGKWFYGKTMEGELVRVPLNDDIELTEENVVSQSKVLDLKWGYEHNPAAILEKNNKIYLGSRKGEVVIVDATKFEIIKQINLGSSSINGFTLDDKGQVWASLIEGGIFLLE